MPPDVETHYPLKQTTTEMLEVIWQHAFTNRDSGAQSFELLIEHDLCEQCHKLAPLTF
jgi:hypothetical protein